MNGEEPSLNVNLAGLKLANPMMTASGTCGYCFEYADLLDLSRLGAFVTKTITAKPRKGNEAYRIVETRGGMLNAIGLANVGLEVFLKEKLPQLRQLRASGPRIIVNIAGHDANAGLENVRVKETLMQVEHVRNHNRAIELFQLVHLQMDEVQDPSKECFVGYQ